VLAHDPGMTECIAMDSHASPSIFHLAKKWQYKSSLFDFASTVSLTPSLPRD
jgi:hypothetical protein